MKNSPERLYLSSYLLYENESDFKEYSTGDYVEEHKTAPDGVPYVTERHHESDTEYIRADLAGVQWHSLEDSQPPFWQTNIIVIGPDAPVIGFRIPIGNLIEFGFTHWAEIDFPNG